MTVHDKRKKELIMKRRQQLDDIDGKMTLTADKIRRTVSVDGAGGYGGIMGKVFAKLGGKRKTKAWKQKISQLILKQKIIT